jgi:ketosteroid isomerase-like protein
MPRQNQYAAFEALDPFFDVVLSGIREFVEGEHFFDIFADDAVFESRYDFPGWPMVIRGCSALMQGLAGYGASIRLHSADRLAVHRSTDERIVIIEYDVHGTVLHSGAAYDNRFISVITIERRKIVHWRDYMDSLAAWSVLGGAE